MKFSMEEVQELIRHLECINRVQFNPIPWGCDHDHMWRKFSSRNPGAFIQTLDLNNLNALGKYFKTKR